MEEKARIRFNPVTKEIEVEGPEAFVRTYFQKLKKMLSQSPEVKREKPAQRQARPVKKGVRPRAVAGKKKIVKETNANKVIALVLGSDAGITTSTLKEKTGLTERQIWSIVYRAEKQGKIKKTKRGLYVAP